jgi:hypothetical protein
LTIKSGNTLGRLEDWKIGYRFIQPSSLPIFRQQLPVLKIKIDNPRLFFAPFLFCYQISEDYLAYG